MDETKLTAQPPSHRRDVVGDQAPWASSAGLVLGAAYDQAKFAARLERLAYGGVG